MVTIFKHYQYQNSITKHTNFGSFELINYQNSITKHTSFGSFELINPDEFY